VFRGQAYGRKRPTAPPGRPRLHLGPDPVLVACVLILIASGTLAVYAATRNGLVAQGRSGTYYLNRDLMNAAIGLVLAWGASRFSLHNIGHLLPMAYAGTVLMLLAVLTPVGATINGAHAWFKIGPLELEPSEFCKVLLILVTAHLLTPNSADPDTPAQRRDLISVSAATGLILLLVLVEPALGVAIVLLLIVFTQITIRGVSAAVLLLTVGLGALVVLGGVEAHALKSYQEARFTSFLSPKTDPTGNGYHLQESEIAIGSGGLVGQGFLDGAQTNGGFVPEQQTDFVFSVVGEESGFLGSCALLVVFTIMLGRGLDIAQRATDPVSRMVASGVTIWFAAQLFINVGMTVGLAPVTGLPLPFVSYGGSALFASLIGVGLLLGIARESDT
jgi:rod shape determining protein RodA